ncbi:MAG: PilT/PilU family type 4a pilus ATPase [Deltaproteobacteria bacterium]|nr:PilT/PilU family type 4a pilus ATPase [Deltaproteobacteria bacterium]
MTDTSTEAFRSHALEVALRIIKGAVAAGASDIHLKAAVSPLVRIDGELCPLEHPALTEALIDSVIEALGAWAGVSPARLARHQIDFSCVVPEVGRFRAHGYHQNGTAALALRRIPHPIPDFAALRLPPVVKRVALTDRGLILISGATGQGKSTTAAAMLDFINQNLARHVITLEDPVEFVFEDQRASFSQREVGRDMETLAQGLEGVWREDPDVLFIGELRTLEEFDVALNAAESGRVVLSSCHAADTARTIGRMISLYPPDFRDSARARIADSLRAIIGQRLVARRGARDRILATEVLIMSPTVQDCVRDPARLRGVIPALEAGTHEFGSHSFDQTLTTMVRDGLITIETAKAAATNPSDLVRNLRVTR